MSFAFPFPFPFPFRRYFSTSKTLYKRHCCKLLVVGGGTGGCSVSARFAKKLCKNEIIVLEPCDIHYNQGMFTLVGGGLKKLRDACKPMIQVLHHNVTWFKDAVDVFCPQSNMVITKNDDCIEYDFMLIAMGLKLNFDEVSNLQEALDYYPNVTTIYSPRYVEKTFEAITRCRSGNAFFTHPTGQVKCLAASQKICYLAEDFFRKNYRRNCIDVRYITPHQTMFPVETYNDALVRITNQRNIYVWRRMNLIRVVPLENVAVFDCLDEPGSHICLEYSLLHVTPPMSPPAELKKSCSELVDSKGFVKVNPFTLQHENFPNVFAVGDCGSPRNSKTTSAISVQSPVVFRNIMACMEGKSPPMNYCGYSACPIITSYGKGILAELDYSYEPAETFLCRQDVERAFVYYLKKDVLPQVYWRLLMKGRWNGPEVLRSTLRLEFLQ